MEQSIQKFKGALRTPRLKYKNLFAKTEISEENK
jgi:hypothetical protein